MLRKLSLLPEYFLPPHLRSSGNETEVERRVERMRARRFVVLTLMMFVGAASSAFAQAAQGLWGTGLGAGLLALLVGGVLYRTRARGPSLFGTVAYVVIGSLGAATLAIGVGHEGYFSLFWLGLGPTIALVIAGPRVARWLLLPVGLLAAAAVAIIVEGVIPPFIRVEHLAGPHIVSLLGAIFTYYLLSATYERETERTIRDLARSNEESRAARAEAEKAVRARGDFLAMMGHEVRTPLNGVLGIASVMLAEGPPPAIAEGLRTIEASGNQLRALLDDVLDYSRYESGQFALEVRPLEVAQVAREALDLMAGSAKARGDALELQVAPGAPRFVLGDEVRLRQILTNLLSNAVKFTEGGAVRVHLRGAADHLELVVEDEGVGMDEAVQARLFQPFMQADESTTRRFGGSGLGLAIVQRVVQRARGRVEVSSQPGRGSRFTVWLPWPACEAPALDERPAPSAARARVLVVEDNLLNLRVAQRLLEQLGHTVTAAGDGAAALECLDRGSFDLVLMDCHMPIMDGFTATQLIRERAGAPPVVALTASTTQEDLERCHRAGMVEVLAKPIRREELQRLVVRFSGKATVAQAPAGG